MKRLLIFLLFMLNGICFAYFDTNEANFPQAAFKSVSNFHTCTAYTPQIRPVGATDVYEDTNNSKRNIRPRRVSVNDDPGDPYATPIGDIPYLMLICFLIYYVYKKKTASI